MPLRLAELPRPQQGPGQLLVKVAACGVCRTDLHIVDGDLAEAKRPVVPGHEVVGRLVAIGSGVAGFEAGQRIGIPWLGATCGQCGVCVSGRGNLCAAARFTGYQIDGGYAEYPLAEPATAFRSSATR